MAPLAGPICSSNGLGLHGYAAVLSNNDSSWGMTVRLDQGGYTNEPFSLQDISMCKDRDGVTDLIIGVTADRRSVYLYNPVTQQLENAGLYDANPTRGTLARPSMAGGHLVMVNAWKTDLSNTQLATFERGGTNIAVKAEGCWNCQINMDGTWYIGTAFGKNWGAWEQDRWHLGVFARNIDNSNSFWLTDPNMHGELPDSNQASMGQWSPTYGSYLVAFQASRICDPVTGMLTCGQDDAAGFAGMCDIAVMQVIWAPDNAGGTEHIAGTPEYPQMQPHSPGFWVGSPSLEYPSTDRENYGDLGWVTYKFLNPWGSGYATSVWVPGMRNYTGGPPGYYNDLPTIACSGTPANISLNVHGHYTIMCDAASYIPPWLYTGYYQ